MSKAISEDHLLIGAQSNDHSSVLAGVSAKRFFTDAATFARVQLLISDYYRVDLPINFWDVYNIEAEALGQKTIYHPGAIPDVDRTKPLIASPADLDRLRPPDPYKSGRLPWVLQVNKYYMEMTGSLNSVYITSPFSLAVNIRGYENLIFDMIKNRPFVHRLFKFLCDEVTVPFVEAMRTEVKLPNLMVDGRDAWASPPMITLDMMDEFVVTYKERLQSKLGDNVITRGNWGDAKSGDPERFFAQKIKCCPLALSVLDPDLFLIGPERVKAFAVKHDVPVTAGIDATLLQSGPIEAIVDRVKLYVHTLGRDGRCTIHLNQIPAATPPEHIHAAVAACHTFGRLPVVDDLNSVDFKPPQRESFAEFLRQKGESL